MTDGGIKLGLQINRFDYPGGPATIGPTLATIGRQAEAAGFSSVWVMDHFFQLAFLGPAEDPMLDSYVALAYVAAVTERLKLGAMVTGVTYRHPGLLIKAVTSLDVLSGGRAYLGIGAAWYEREHLGLGVPFPPLKERFERLEETLQIAHLMWSGEVRPFQGTHYQLAEPINQPAALSTPRPPILIGGGGEQKTLRLVAKYGDACNLFAHNIDTLTHKLDVLKRHCEAEGRPYAEIEKTTIAGWPADAGDSREAARRLVAQLKVLAELGIDHHLINLPTYTDPTIFEAIGEIVAPAAAQLRVAGR